jgi:hypothetical protein
MVLLELLTGKRAEQYDLRQLVKANTSMLRITR